MIRDSLYADPGSDSVALHFSSGEGSGVWIDAGSRYLVENSENLRSQLKGQLAEQFYFIIHINGKKCLMVPKLSNCSEEFNENSITQ